MSKLDYAECGCVQGLRNGERCNDCNYWDKIEDGRREAEVLKRRSQFVLIRGGLAAVSLLLLLLLCACGRGWEPSLAPYVERFEAAGGFSDIVGVTVAFADSLDGSEEGSCDRSPFGSHVLIKRSYWENASEDEREVLMFHELGHCALGLGHAATGIMRASLLTATEYRASRAQLLTQLFTEGR